VAESFDDSSSNSKSSSRTVEQKARELLCQVPHFRGHAGSFECEYRDGVLIVRGRVPTFYLKQVLQTVLKEIKGVSHIDNQVDVISSFGVSSVRGTANAPAD
jgi:hypothetical protein